ncbi:MAG: RNA-binding S4 domain-containing protein [Armatimonadetes bacterium]|nr:RNA-binding S4 domain-containing protein [Armatimonadota bacterium]
MVQDPTIKLDQFLKLVGATSSGGEAKQAVQAGRVQVNGEVETRRGRKLRNGDRVELEGQLFTVELEPRDPT